MVGTLVMKKYPKERVQIGLVEDLMLSRAMTVVVRRRQQTYLHESLLWRQKWVHFLPLSLLRGY